MSFSAVESPLDEFHLLRQIPNLSLVHLIPLFHRSLDVSRVGRPLLIPILLHLGKLGNGSVVTSLDLVEVRFESLRNSRLRCALILGTLKSLSKFPILSAMC